MSYIPSQLTYSLSKLGGFSKNVLLIKPLNKTTFGASEILTIRLPTNDVIDLHSLALSFTATPSLSVLPKYASSMISRLEVLCNGSSIFGAGLSEYNTLYNTFANLLFGADKQQELAAYGGATDIVAQPSEAGDAKKLTIDHFLGFLGGSMGRYIHTGILGAIEIRISIANPSVLSPISTAAGAQTFSWSNVQLMVDTLTFSDNWFGKSLQTALQTGPIIYPFKNFASFSYSIGANAGSVNTAYGSESLDALYGFLRPVDYDSTSASVAIPDANTGNSHYFKFMADGATFRWRVNNIMVPSFDVNAQSAYQITKNTCNGGGLNLAYVNKIADPTVWSQGKFAFGISLKLHDDTPLSRLASGLNSLGSQLPIEFSFMNAAGSSYRPFIIAETTSYLEIHAGQAVTYHP